MAVTAIGFGELNVDRSVFQHDRSVLAAHVRARPRAVLRKLAIAYRLRERPQFHFAQAHHGRRQELVTYRTIIPSIANVELTPRRQKSLVTCTYTRVGC